MVFFLGGRHMRAEFGALCRARYRGPLDFVDDNSIGNVKAKSVCPRSTRPEPSDPFGGAFYEFAR
jgi:hypothetical protein